MLRLSNSRASLKQGLIDLKGLKTTLKVVVIQGLIFRKSLVAKAFFRNLKMCLREKE